MVAFFHPWVWYEGKLKFSCGQKLLGVICQGSYCFGKIAFGKQCISKPAPTKLWSGMGALVEIIMG